MNSLVNSTRPKLPHEIVRAGAGAGKTTGLIQKVVDVYMHFKKLEHRPRLVITTFSRKATQEVKERLLVQALKMGDEDFLEFVSSSHSVVVTTIHGVLLQFLSRFGVMMGLSADFEFRESSQLQRQNMQILRQLLKTMNLHELLGEWRLSELLSCANQFYAHKMAGTWIKFLDEQQIYNAFKSICAQGEMLAIEINGEIQRQQAPKWQGLVEALTTLSKILCCEEINKQTFSDIYLNLQSLKPVLKKPNRSSKAELFPELHEQFENLLELVDQLLAQDPELIVRQMELFQKIEKLFLAYSEQKLQQTLTRGDLTFADLELLSLQMIKSSPEAAQSFSEEWDYWFVDEYQDTSPVQVQLLKSLIGDKSHFVVGDPQQSIYLFRGARSEVFSAKQDEIESNGGLARELMRNYRSTPQLLSFINHLFTRFGERFRAMEPKEGDHIRSEVVADICWVDNPEDELRAAVLKVQGLLAKGVKPEDICILARRRQNLKILSREFHKMGVPYFVHISSGFAERREVQDILALLRFAFIPEDAANLIQLCRTPWFFIPDWQLAEVRALASPSFWEKLSETFADHESIRRLKEYLERCESFGLSESLLQTLKGVGFFQASQQMDGSGRREANVWKILKMIEQAEQDGSCNLLSLETSIYEGQSSTEDAAADAVSAVEPDRVNLMTIHGSKGLQFDHVLIPFMGESPRFSNIPLFYCDEETGVASIKCRDNNEDRAHFFWLNGQFRKHRKREELESERLLYVATTRAKKSLYFSSVKKFAASSWAQCLQMEEGVHQMDDFALQVIDFKADLAQSDESFFDKQKIISRSQIPEPWKVFDRADVAIASKGVTAMVEEQVYHAAAPSNVDKKSLWRRVQKSEQGVLLHRLFEALRYHGSIGVERVIKSTLSEQSEAIGEALQFVLQLSEPPMIQLLRSGYAEWGFTVKEQGQWLRGQIDLWGVIDDTLWVVDYKTGHLDLEKAFLQLEHYTQALVIARKAPAKINLSVVQPFLQTVVSRPYH